MDVLNALNAFLRKLTWLGGRRRRQKEDDLRQELEFHLAQEAEEARASGLSEEQARLVARRDFGSILIAVEDTRTAWGWTLLDQTAQDLRYAARTLARSPSFTVAAVLTLALGTGANTAIFSIVNAVMLKPLPYAHDEQLVRVLEHLPGSMQRDGKPGIFRGLESRDFATWENGSQLLSAVAAYDAGVAMTLSNTQNEAVRLTSASATLSLFPLLGVQPSLGPGFRANDEDLSRTVVLSFATWKRHFASDANLVGRSVTLDGASYRVAGVMPEGFAFPSRSTALWVPLIPRIDANGGTTDYEVIGRLKQGVSPDAASAEASSLLRGLQGIIAEQPAGHASYEVLRIKDDMVAPVRPALLVLLAGVGLLLLVACANVAHLVLARNASRQGEAAIRVALGAGRARLVRQLLTESALLGLLGGAAGVGIAAAGLDLLRSFAPADLPRLEEVQLDMPVFGFALALSAFMGVLLGALPAWRVSRANPITGIKSDVGSRASRRDASRSVLVIAEVATATILLIGGGLLLRSFVTLANVNPGFDVERLLVFQVALPRGTARATALTMSDAFRDRLAALPGVKSAAFANTLPLRQRNGTAPRIEGFPPGLEGRPDARIVSSNYPVTMGIQLRQGHGFESRGTSGQPMEVLVNETLARAFGANVIGAPLTVARQPATIVGVVADTREGGLDRDIQPLVYMDARDSSLRMVRAESAIGWAFYAVRTDTDPRDLVPAVKRVLHDLVPAATLELDVDSMDGIIARSVSERRFYAVVFGLFATLALMLAAIGVYGVMAYLVTQRTREIGIRMALGAATGDVLRLVLRQSAPATCIGILTGLVGAISLTRFLRGMLFGLTPLDPSTFVGVVLLLSLVATVAALIPARRATGVDPLIALRYE